MLSRRTRRPGAEVRILEKDPTTLDEALKLACRMEAIVRSPPEDNVDDQGRQRDRFARSSTEAEAAHSPEVDHRFEKLESMQGEYRFELKRYR